MNIYRSWGFRQSPFGTDALPPSELGTKLLIGRDKEVNSLLRRIANAPRISTLEGPNGVGKTSIVNVAAFRAHLESLDGSAEALFIPCNKVFQLSSERSAQEFEREVLREVAQSLITRADEFSTRRRGPTTTAAVDKWLNSPQLKTWQGGIPVFNIGQSAETNTSEGYELSGFRRQVVAWLQDTFPPQDGGGVICVIDNLELLETSANARAILEQLRDPLFSLPGLRWVLCGANGIISGVASSPRLTGLLQTPIAVSTLAMDNATDVLSARVSAFADEPLTAYLPIRAQDFQFLFKILAGNLRSALGEADSYCHAVADDGVVPTNETAKAERFQRWLNEHCEGVLSAVNAKLTPAAWRTFDRAVERGGEFSPSDYQEFGFSSDQALRPSVRDLETLGLLDSSTDETDQRRKTIRITAKGWFVQHARSKRV